MVEIFLKSPNVQRDTLVRQSIITLALLHKIVYKFRGNNTYIIQEKTALYRKMIEPKKILSIPEVP